LIQYGPLVGGLCVRLGQVGHAHVCGRRGACLEAPLTAAIRWRLAPVHPCYMAMVAMAMDPWCEAMVAPVWVQ